MDDLTRLISVVEIESVTLREASCRCLVRPLEAIETFAVDSWQDVLVVKEPDDDGLLLIETRFWLKILSDDDDEELLADIHGSFELAYLIPQEERFSSDAFAAFGHVNSVFNSWPYWRELVHSSLARMSMPMLTIPVYRVSLKEPGDNEN